MIMVVAELTEEAVQEARKLQSFLDGLVGVLTLALAATIIYWIWTSEWRIMASVFVLYVFASILQQGVSHKRRRLEAEALKPQQKN